MKFKNLILGLAVIILLSSCAAPKVAYLQDLHPGNTRQVLNPREIIIQPKDKISILVNSKDPLLANLFNLPIISRQVGAVGSGSNNAQGISGYTVDKDGYIDFPVLGKIYVAGKTREDKKKEMAIYPKNLAIIP